VEKARMEIFSDGVIAILMTILVLELVPPQTTDLNALLQLRGQFIAYGISYFVLAIYWVNHHHLLQIADRINGQVLWANILSLFSISFIPFVTGWLGKNFTNLLPTLLYGVVFLTTTVTFAILQYSLIKCNGEDSNIAKALSYRKPLISMSLGIIAVLFAFILPILTPIAVVVNLTMWSIPARTIEYILK